VMAKKVNCPACGCDVTDRVRNAAALRLSKRMNRQHVDRVANLLVAAEDVLDSHPEQHSAGTTLWRADVRAIRYVFNRLVACQSDEPEPPADAVSPGGWKT
jgi:hypothetical protein